MTQAAQTQETETRILHAAINVFARKGKDGARMQEIADRAGINKALLHYYYRNKEKLYEAVFGHVFQTHTMHQVASIKEAGSFAERLKFFINAFVESAVKEPDIVLLMVNENLSGGHALKSCLMAGNHEDGSLPGFMIQAMKEAIAEKKIRPVDPYQTMLSIISCCLFFLIWVPTVKVRIPGAADDWEAFVEARKEHIFDLIYHGLEPSTP